MRKRLKLEASLYQILQILSLTLFEKTPILCALQATGSATDRRPGRHPAGQRQAATAAHADEGCVSTLTRTRS
jgi:hypothetical protein